MDSLFDCDVYIQKKIYSKNTDESLDKCRRVQTNVDESQNNVDKCRGVQTCSHQTSVDESLDGRSHRYANFQFVVLSVITAPYNVPTPYISKTHLPNVSLHVCELELTNQAKREVLLCVEAQLSLHSLSSKALRFIKRSSFSSQRYASSEYVSI